MSDGYDEIYKLIQDTPEGFVVFMINSPENKDDIIASTMKLEDFFSVTKDRSRFFIISTSARCGWSYFTRYLELKHFHPSTSKNDLYVTFDFKWGGLPFSCVTIPKEYHADISDSFLATNMKPVYGAVPTMLTSSGMVPMPICPDNCITVENGEDHLIYKNDADAASKWQIEQILKLEDECLK